MEFRKKIKIENADKKIDHSNDLISVGSCFSDSIGRKLSNNKFTILQNPQGIIFHPIALVNVFKELESSDVFIKNNTAYSWSHHSSINEKDEKSLFESLAVNKKEVLTLVKDVKEENA